MTTKPIPFNPKSLSAAREPAITIVNDYLKSIQKRHAMAITFIPFVGVLAGMFQIWKEGLGWQDISLLLTMYVLTVVGLEVGLHRYFSHKSFEAKPSLQILLAVLGAMAAQGPLIYWVANHRRHHQYSDRSGDPHSPHLQGDEFPDRIAGFWHAYMGWIFDHETPNPRFFVKDALRDPLLSQLDRLYLLWILLGLTVPAVVGGMMYGSFLGLWHGFLWGGLIRLFLVNQGTTFIVNSCCHTMGTRPFATNDQSTNNGWLCLPTFGSSWHNNHHAFPDSAISGLEWWQLDLSGWVIRALALLGFVWNVKTPTVERVFAKKGHSC